MLLSLLSRVRERVERKGERVTYDIHTHLMYACKMMLMGAVKRTKVDLITSSRGMDIPRKLLRDSIHRHAHSTVSTLFFFFFFFSMISVVGVLARND